MRISFGPWWLIDIVLLIIVFSASLRGLKKGIWRSLYFFVGELIIILLISFIPQLIVNVTMPWWQALINTIGLNDILSGDTLGLNSALAIIFDFIGVTVENIDTSGVSNELITTTAALIGYIISALVLFITFNIVMWIMYGLFGKRIRRAKINRNVDMTFGLIFGFMFGMGFVGTIAPLFRLPIFDLSTQKLGFSSTENDLYTSNEYNDYAITSNITKFLPPGAVGYNYSLACISKYALTPVLSLLEQPAEGEAEVPIDEKLKNIAFNMENTIIDGYTSSGLFDLSIKSCLEKAPNVVKSTLRFFPELILGASGMFTDTIKSQSNSKAEIPGIGFSQTDAQANKLFDSFDVYKTQNNLSSRFRFSKSTFVEWYNWAKDQPLVNNKSYNQFIVAADQLDRENTLQIEYKIIDILRNPKDLYEFMRNVYTSNNRDQRPGLVDFLPNVYMVAKVMNGLELVPSGIVAELLGHYIKDDGNWSFDILNFKLKDYMDFIGSKLMQVPGIDIVKIDRMKIDKNFYEKFLSIFEIKKLNEIENIESKLEFLAGRWAAKEAIFKAFNHSLKWNQIDIDYLQNRPVITNKELENIKISISHDGEYAIAIAIFG